MPEMVNGSLYSCLHDRKVEFDEEEKMRIAKEIAAGMKGIYEWGRTHGDL